MCDKYRILRKTSEFKLYHIENGERKWGKCFCVIVLMSMHIFFFLLVL